MRLTNYRLQTEMENIKESSIKWFKDYVKEVLESDRPYYAKADYLGLCLQELQNKIDYISEDIKELQALKRKLTNAKKLSQEVIAEVLSEYGIDRLDGSVISSLTITPKKVKTKESFKIKDEEALIKLGYYKVVVDEEAVKEAMKTLESIEEIDPYVEIGLTEEIVPAKVRVNSRKPVTIDNHQAIELLNVVNSTISDNDSDDDIKQVA